jgi:hypothetical protein
MGTKVGLTGITFGDATVQNTAAVTGVTSLTAGSGISLSGSTGAVTVTNSSPGAVSSVNGQTGAVVDTSLGSIGSIAWGIVQDGTTGLAGATIAGSSLYYGTTHNGGGVNSVRYAGNGASNVEGTYASISQVQRASATTGAYKALQNVSNFSGTWRLLYSLGPREYSGLVCDGYSSFYPVVLVVRVS